LPTDPDDLLNTAAVKKASGDISDMTLFRWTRDRGFPKPDKIIAARKYWWRSTVENWLAQQPSADDVKIKAPRRSTNRQAQTEAGAAA
jgi:predicted DNA-binding transcriptional regulator AlpA